MMTKMKEMKVEKKAKLKFLASALFFCTFLEKKIKENKQRNAMNQWKQNVYLKKVRFYFVNVNGRLRKVPSIKY